MRSRSLAWAVFGANRIAPRGKAQALGVCLTYLTSCLVRWVGGTPGCALLRRRHYSLVMGLILQDIALHGALDETHSERFRFLQRLPVLPVVMGNAVHSNYCAIPSTTKIAPSSCLDSN